jgi:putative SbcD/Mre11-related phosphoesterase
MNIQPVYDHPALRIDNMIVIADLHIGIESRLGRKGFHVPSGTDIMRDDILGISGDASQLVILGDVKDSMPGSTKQEYREIPDFFCTMLERFDIVDVVIGNHDTLLDEFLPKGVNLHPASGLKIGSAGFVHGHTWPSPEVMASDILITAHNHPTVMFMDGVGRRASEQCWLRAPLRNIPCRYIEYPKEVVMMPSFNRLHGGSPVNVEGERFLGPLMNSDMVDVGDAEIFLLDGISLGKRKDIMIKCKKYKE